MKFTISLLLCASMAFAQATADQQAALQRITANSLKGDVAFLASDLLEGRDTPSAGLNIAAEFIAAQFRRAGLEPIAPDGSYLQTASMVVQTSAPKGHRISLRGGEKDIVLDEGLLVRNEAALQLKEEIVWKFDAESLRKSTPAELKDKVIVLETLPMQAARQLQQSAAKLIIIASRMPSRGAAGRIVDKSRPSYGPIVSVESAELRDAIHDLPTGRTQMLADIRLAAPEEKPFQASNVVGILRGSDPELSNTFVLVSAHYDHLGISPREGADRIFNGANDDASGTASVIEAAYALGALKQRPKRSIVFMAFFGEEKGLIGSRYFAGHPLIALDKAVASLSLEQIGRTDEEKGPAIKSVRFTGQDFSDLPTMMRPALEAAGVKIELDDSERSASFFARSDNVSFAEKGIPAHTLCVAYVYPDYHGLADHWDKLDYTNMETVVRGITAGLLSLADNTASPKWNKDNPAAARFAK